MIVNARPPVRLPILPAMLTAAVAFAFAQGCAPLIAGADQQSLLTVRQIVVVPVTDAPHAGSVGSGVTARGAIVQGLHRLGRYDLINVSLDDITRAAAEAGYDLGDCYDPHVAAAIGRELGADAVVCGELTHWSTRQEMDQSSLLIVSSGGTKTYHYVGLSLRIVQTSDAEIIYSDMGSGRSDTGYTSAVEAATEQGMSELQQFARMNR